MNEINGFKLWDKEPNTICGGARVYTKRIFFDTQNKNKRRLIRVYLPSTYDFDNPDTTLDSNYTSTPIFDTYWITQPDSLVDNAVYNGARERLNVMALARLRSKCLWGAERAPRGALQLRAAGGRLPLFLHAARHVSPL